MRDTRHKMAKNVNEYVTTAIRDEQDPNARQTLLNDYNRYRTAKDRYYARSSSAVLKATAPRLAKRALKRRYDDLFEELMKYMTPDEIVTQEDYYNSLKSALEPRVEKGTLRDTNIRHFYEELIQTPKAEKFFREKNVEQITPGKSEQRNEKFVKDERRAIYHNYIREGREIWRVVNQENKTVTIVYRTHVTTKKGERIRFRDVGTGRFGTNPYHLRAKFQQGTST